MLTPLFITLTGSWTTYPTSKRCMVSDSGTIYFHEHYKMKKKNINPIVRNTNQENEQIQSPFWGGIRFLEETL
jgi:putative SOS response-associated peptidase YedK